MKYFTISELTKSDTADTFKIDNTPTPEAVDNMENLINRVLDPIREAFGSAIIVTSGYRCEKLNKKVKGSATSHHRCINGYAAADIKAMNGKNKELLELIKSLGMSGAIKWTQLINEYPNKKGIPSWIHISTNVDDSKNKMQVLTIG